MHDVFISLVVPVGDAEGGEVLSAFLALASEHLADNFADYEIIIVDNGSAIDFSRLSLDEAARSNCYLVSLAKPTIWDKAILSGFERANGDFAACFDVSMGEHLGVLLSMFEAAANGADIVYLRDRRSMSFSPSIRRNLFFLALRLSGRSTMHPRDRREFLVSRRALNWIVRDKPRQWYLNEALLSHGFKQEYLEVELPKQVIRRSAVEEREQAWASLARSSQLFLNAATFVIATLSIIIAVAVSNAVAVRVFGRNLLWQPAEVVPGWAYIVALVSFGFLMMTMLIYIVMRLQVLILEEVRETPPYVVEHFGRI